MAKPRRTKREARIEAIRQGLVAQTSHPLLGALPAVEIDYEQQSRAPAREAWLVVDYEYAPPTKYYGETLRLIVRPNLDRDSEPGDWPWAIARVRMHAALSHIDPQRTDLAWSAACWAVAEALLINAGLGSRPAWLAPLPQGYKFTDEHALADRLREKVPDEFLGLGLGVKGQPFWTCNFPALTDKMRRDASRAFADGVREAASAAVAGAGFTQARAARKDSEAEQCRSWFVSNY